MSSNFSCPYCGKTVKTECGLKQHINKSTTCNELQRREFTLARSIQGNTDEEDANVTNKKESSQGRRRSGRLQNDDEEDADQVELGSESDAAPTDGEHYKADSEGGDADGEDDSTEYGMECDNDSEVEMDADLGVKPAANTHSLDEFKEYCSSHSNRYLPLTKEEVTSIRLLDCLKRKKAPLNAYQELLEWHLKETEHLLPHETLKDTTKFIHRKTLLKRLMKRYHLEPMVPKLKRLRLPHSKAVVTIPYRKAEDCIVSLLTDPRVEDKHYLFFDRDPCAPPPEKVVYIEDTNTGDAFLESHKKYITKPNQVPLGIKFYIDGANTGQFSDLPVTALKLALAIHSREMRDEEWAWRELAWIPQVRKQKARGKKLLKESRHMESQDVELMEGEGEYADSDDEDAKSVDEDGEPAVKAQDFHTMLSFALKSFVDLQKTGLIWDTAVYGKVFEGLEFVLFVIDVKCDSEEGDLLCGKYTVRTKNVKHLCRACHCPTDQGDNPMAKYKMKTQKDIERLVERGDREGLRRISQQNIQNAWYPVRFHAANDRGIHGACPSEMLHALLLGLFKYLRDIFFKFMGEESQMAQDMDGLAQLYGKLLSHQSDRDLPHTNFAKGIHTGKLMAKQYRGVLLNISAMLRSSLGRRVLLKRKKFGGKEGLRDWTLLVELLLEWEAFLCEKRMKRSHVLRLARKNQYIMYIMKNVAVRSQGMGLKIMKFHAVLHLVEDILLFGVPSEFDTGSNESHHKKTKVAAKMTQRNEVVFDHQTAKRMTEFMIIELAMVEVKGGKMVWEYFSQVREEDWEYDDTDSGAALPNTDGLLTDMEALNVDEEEDDTESSDELQIRTGGTRIRIFEDSDLDDEPSFQILGRSMHKRNTRWSTQLVAFLNDLQKLVIDYIPEKELPVLTEHKRGDVMFRGHPNHRGQGPWKDWALVDWGGGYGVLPSHIWCFVDLKGLPSGRSTLEYGGIQLQDGVHAVVEVATYDEEPDEEAQNEDVVPSDLFVPLTLEVNAIDENGEVTARKFCLAPVEAIVGPCIVIPDVGGFTNGYFQVKPRREWKDEFIAWLKSPHADDVMVQTEVESEEEEATQPNKKAKH